MLLPRSFLNPYKDHMRDSGNVLPLYQKVKDHVLRQIWAGRWRSSDRIPSESELVRMLKVSRMTANRALRELSDSGVIVRVAGVGTFVADSKATAHPLQIRNIADEIRERGHTHRAKLVLLEDVPASAEVQTRLALGESAHAFHSIILHLENDTPLQLEDRFVAPAAAPDYLKVDFGSVTPYEYLTRVAPLQRVQHIVKATVPSARVKRLLRLAGDEPVLLVERVTWSRDKPATFARLYHPGSRYELSGTFNP